MFTALLIFHAFIALLLIIVVIIQPGQAEGGVAMMGGSSTGSAFGAETGAVLTKTTAVLGAIFMLNSLILAVVGPHFMNQSSVVEKVIKEQQHKGKK
ncbi:preprotein translocase subunit SecG [Thermovibrio ammonificans]|jgi:preprotein translocase subunit SecG|uniref:Protein-export membrane protein SecG n=1 Tax=Thermovibrio ammonificans (strain DSM 15698 / JCM 12110 / HB-1) TaxID=648996 RepID=E8T639_THEA1|nr:preprotein translocase subunit SecG [Thermovibrio ammonificans]ADU96623.1 preprotein translocase, SecG subunit [Thermovibrio ammonificans HB-1]